MNNNIEQNIIKFYLGEETHPVIDNKERLKHSIFRDQIEKALDIIEEKIQSINDKKYSNAVINRNYSNNIISFIGERGSGKTSCMYSVLEIIKKENSSSYDEYKKKILQPLDPSFFDDTHNILEVFIGEIFNDANVFIRELKEKKTEAHELMKQFENVKRDMHYLDKETLFERDDELDELEYLSSGIKLEKSIETLINSYLKLIGCNFLIISVDDIDLNTKQAYSMVEQIRKYLVLPNVAILFAVKIDQLANVIENSLIGEFKNAIDKGVVSTSSIYEMSERYLNKFLPINNRIYLPNTEVLFEKKIQISKYNEEKEEVLEEWDSVKNLVTKLIAEKCDYKFFNSKGKTSEIVPRNLRDLRLLISLLWNMKTEDKIHNREIFKNYLFTSWIEHLDFEEKSIARMLLKETEPTLFNKAVVCLLYNHIVKTENVSINEEISKIIKPENLPYNISLGDAFYVINYFIDRVNNVNIRRLLFFVKALYTIKLTDYYEEIKDRYSAKEKEDKEEKYYKREILENISNYEKLIGGNFFYLNGSIILPKENGRKDREIRLINGKKLFQFIEDIKNEYNNHKISLDFEAKLNIVEFFILTTMTYHRSKSKPGLNVSGSLSYRLDDRCYYDMDFNNSSNLVFNFVFPLFSLINIDKTYKRFSSEILEIAKDTKSSLYNKIYTSKEYEKLYPSINSSDVIDDLFFYTKQRRFTKSKNNIEVFKEYYSYISKYKSLIYTEQRTENILEVFFKLLDSSNYIYIDYFNDVFPNFKVDLEFVYNAISHYYGDFFIEYYGQKISPNKLKEVLTDDIYFKQLKEDNGKISKKSIKDIITTYATVRNLKELDNVNVVNIMLQVMLKNNIFIQENQMYESVFNIDTLIEQSEEFDFDELD